MDAASITQNQRNVRNVKQMRTQRNPSHALNRAVLEFKIKFEKFQATQTYLDKFDSKGRVK